MAPKSQEDILSRIAKLRAVADPSGNATPAEQATARGLADELEAKLAKRKPRSTAVRSTAARGNGSDSFDSFLAHISKQPVAQAFGSTYWTGGRPGHGRLCRVGYPDVPRKAFVASLQIGTHVSIFVEGQNFTDMLLPRRRESTVQKITRTGIIVLQDGTQFNGLRQKHTGYRRGETGRLGWRTYLARPDWPYKNE